jgi:predicted RNase H-like HicB family nuclease
LPGCVAVGETRREVLRLIREAVELHIESLRESIIRPSTMISPLPCDHGAVLGRGR